MLALTSDVVLWWVPVILLMLADSNSKLIIARVAQCVLFPEKKQCPVSTQKSDNNQLTQWQYKYSNAYI